MHIPQAADRAPESFRGLLLRYRGRAGLTQRDLVARLGASRRAVQDWEAGVSHPSAQRLQALILVLLEAGSLSLGREQDEAAELWAAVLRETPRMQTPFDQGWFASMVSPGAGPPRVPGSDVLQAVPAAKPGDANVERSQDWGEAPDILGFVGRAQELTTLRSWVVEQRCRLVAVLGLGGVGKTALAVRLAQEITPSFQRVFWRSLRDAPPTSDWLARTIGFLSDQRLVPPDGEAARLAALLELLRERPSLLVLDNFETLLEPGEREGRYRADYAGYGRLLEAVGEGRHASCLLLTSREAPPELAVLGGSAVRSFALGGLGVDAAQVLLASKQLEGTSEQWAELNARFGGNGLALKVVGERIRELFGGHLGTFLDEAGAETVFGGIRRVLAEQVGRSTAVEQDVLRVLAVAREPMPLGELLAALGPALGRGAVLDAVEAQRRRSLVERAEMPGAAAFTLQSVVLEYVTDRLVEEVGDEIARGEPRQLVVQPLIKAQAKDYVRQTQERLIGEPLLQRLRVAHGDSGAEQSLLGLLDHWRDRPPDSQGYGPGNAVNLLRLERGDLRRLNLARLFIRQAYLAGSEAQDASLIGAQLSESVLADAFSFPIAVALSGDGASLVAGTAAGEVRLWRVADRTPLLAAHAHTGPAYGVAVSGDGQMLASGSEDGTIRLWEAVSGRLLATLREHSSPVRGVTLSADGQLLASGGDDDTVRLWDAASAQLRGTLMTHSGGVWGIALSADGQLLASGGWDGAIRLWETPSGMLLATLPGHTGGVRAVALSADGQLLASGGLDGSIRLWATPKEMLLVILEGHTGGVRGVALSGDGQLLASGGEDGTVRLWEAASGRPLATLLGHVGGVRGVALSADGQLLASGGLDGTMRLWESAGGRLLATLQGHTSGVWGVALSGDGQLLASGSADGTVWQWETSGGRMLATLRGHTSGVWSVALSADGRLLASASWDGTVRVWASPAGRLLTTLEEHAGPVHGVALSADGQLLASAGADGTVWIWDVPRGRLLAASHRHAGAVWGVALSADGRLLASAGEDGTVRLWTSSNAQLMATLRGHMGGALGVALSADGRLLASGGLDGTVRLWETTGGQMLAGLHGHTGGVRGLALSRDGGVLASGSQDGTVRLWEVRNGRLMVTVRGHTSGVWSVALSADGRLLASGGDDGTVQLWEAPSGRWLRSVRSDRRCERLDITGLTAVTVAQRAALLALGAVEHHGRAGEIGTTPERPLAR
jgi:WD40 repeat protein/transcriptional regulator with XRE-family HTH domain